MDSFSRAFRVRVSTANVIEKPGFVGVDARFERRTNCLNSEGRAEEEATGGEEEEEEEQRGG